MTPTSGDSKLQHSPVSERYLESVMLNILTDPRPLSPDTYAGMSPDCVESSPISSPVLDGNDESTLVRLGTSPNPGQASPDPFAGMTLTSGGSKLRHSPVYERSLESPEVRHDMVNDDNTSQEDEQDSSRIQLPLSTYVGEISPSAVSTQESRAADILDDTETSHSLASKILDKEVEDPQLESVTSESSEMLPVDDHAELVDMEDPPGELLKVGAEYHGEPTTPTRGPSSAMGKDESRRWPHHRHSPIHEDQANRPSPRSPTFDNKAQATPAKVHVTQKGRRIRLTIDLDLCQCSGACKNCNCCRSSYGVGLCRRWVIAEKG
jgi:hypothetical protein